MSKPLAPLPSAVGVFPNLIAQKTEVLIMKGENLGRDFNISLYDGTPIIRVDAERWSRSHRKDIFDATSGTKLCQIRKPKKLRFQYVGEQSENSPNPLFELESHVGLLGGSKHDITFANVAGNGQPMQLQFKSGAFGVEHEVTLNGMPVAVIERKMLKMRTEYHLHVAAGMDMFLIAAVAICLQDKARTQAAAAAGAGGGAGATG